MGQKIPYLIAAFLISGCSYTLEGEAFDSPYFSPEFASSSYYQPVAYVNYGQPILTEPLYFDGVPVSFYPVDDGVYELVDPDGYVVGYAYLDGIDRLRITDLEGNTLYFLFFDGGGYFRAFDPFGGYLTYYGNSFLAHHFHNNRDHFNAPFFRSGLKARKHFRARANKHRKARLRHNDHQGKHKFSSRGAHHGDHQKFHSGKRKAHHDGGEKKKHAHRGSGWKPVESSGQAFDRPNPSPRGLNTGGASFGSDFPFQPQAQPAPEPRGKRHGRKAKKRAKRQSPQQQPAATEMKRQQRRQPPAATQASRQSPQQQPAVTQVAPARRPQRQTRRAVNVAPASPPAKATKSSEPKSEPSSPRRRSQRSSSPRHRDGPRERAERR